MVGFALERSRVSKTTRRERQAHNQLPYYIVFFITFKRVEEIIVSIFSISQDCFKIS